MRASLKKLLWLSCALLMVLQAVAPASAMALVSIRCIGAPAAMPDCAHSVMAVPDIANAGTHMASMACCHHMGSNCAMKDGILTTTVHPSLSPLTCLVTIHPFSTERSTALTNVRRWMLNAAPALAPPAPLPIFPLRSTAFVILPISTFELPPSFPVHSHGLRAPPTL